jgi:hypothetical protein
MKRSKSTNNIVKDIIVYKENKPFVRRALKDGRIDYLDMTKWTFIDKFFAFLISVKFFSWCATTFPTPRKYECIPIWFLLSCVIQMKLHQTSVFLHLPGILRAGSILTRVKFNIGHKDGGFNYKNRRERRAPIHQDTWRKYFKAVKAGELEKWYNTDVVSFIRRHRGFDKRGIFILDHTYLSLPDNENYTHAARMPLDEHDNLINVDRLSKADRRKIKYKLCYGLTGLLHLSDADTEPVYIYGGVHLGAGDESGLKAGEELVDGFVKAAGKGVIKRLIVDRGFIDGVMISRFKKKHEVDTLVPLRSDMNILEDAIGLTRLKGHQWKLYKEEKDKDGKVIKKQEVCGFSDMRSWDQCDIPLYIALMREWTEERGEQIWGLISTEVFKHPHKAFDLYTVRSSIEERHKQLKECWKIKEFSSPDFNLDTTHVIFSILTYTLIQIYLLRKNLQSLANKTITKLRQDERFGKDAIIVYAKNNFATFDTDDYTYILLTLKEPARARLTKWVKVFKKRKPRAP